MRAFLQLNTAGERRCSEVTPDTRPGLLMPAAVIGALAALAVSVRLGFRDPTLRAAIETGLAVSMVISAWLLHARFERTQRFSDLLTVAALTMLVASDLAFMAVPAALGPGSTDLIGGGPFAAQVLIAGALAAAAFTPSRLIVTRGRNSLALVVVGAGTAGCLAIGSIVPNQHGSVILTATAAGFLFVAAAAFWRRAAQERQTVSRMLAWGCLLLAIAWIYAQAHPVPSVAWVSGREALRGAAYVLLLFAGLRSWTQTQRAIADDAAARERYRIINDLHDGLAQDLAFIAAHSSRLAHAWGDEHPVAVAARRALQTSRGTIADLAATDAPTAAAALRTVAGELGSRDGVDVSVRAEPTALTGREREELVRIAREAIANAIRHGHARHIDVLLQARPEGLILRVGDDGTGFSEETPHASPRGLGLRAMRERAGSLGGRLRVRRRDGRGTEVEVVVP